MYRGSGVRTKGSKRGRGGQRSTWNEACDAPAETTYYQKRRNSFTRKLPLLDPPEHPYDHRRKKHALANKVGASRFNWKQADATCHYTPSHLVYPPADSQSQDQLEDDPSGYGQAASFCGQEERNQSPSAFSDDYGQESKITSEDPWSDEYQGRESERSHSERDVDERLEKMRKELSDYARDERIYKTQLKEYRAQNHELLLCRSGQMKTIKKLKADLVEWAKRKEADGMKISQLTKQLEAKYNEAASRDIEQSKRIVQLEAELLAATKKAELSAKEALDEHLNRLKEQLVASSYLPDNMAVLQVQHDKLRAYTSQLEAKVAEMKSKVDTAKTEKHSEELKRKECEKKFRKEIDAVHAFVGGSVVDKLKLSANALRLLKADVNQLRQIAHSTNRQCSIEFLSARAHLQQMVATFAAYKCSRKTNVQMCPKENGNPPRDPRKRRM